MLMAVFEGVPQANVKLQTIKDGIGVIDLLSEETGFFKSKGEVRRSLKENAISINKAKVPEDYVVTEADIVDDKLILAQRGKKNYYLIVIEQ